MSHVKTAHACSLLALLALAAPLSAQQDVLPSSEWAGYLRLLDLGGRAEGLPLIYHSMSAYRSARTLGAGPWDWRAGNSAGAGRLGGRPEVRLMPLEVRVVGNSRFASSTNDGALWAGRGLSSIASGGIAARWGPLSARAYPSVFQEGNASFDIVATTAAGVSPYAYPYHGKRIDWPQRFGDRSRVGADWGQSEVRLDFRALTLGLSTENLVWGPAVLNPIVMSATAPGFPHVDLGLGPGARTPLGPLELRLVWGRLAESAYFDTIADNDHRLFTGLTLALAPRWIPGLTLGLTRVLYTNWDDSLRFVDFVDVFQPFFKAQLVTSTDPLGNDDRDQLLSLTARWVLRESQFETWVEWARNDHNKNLRDFILEPQHSQGFTLGLQKAFGGTAGGRTDRLRLEVTALGRSPTFQARAEPTFYVHHLVTQGYTHRGQLLGAGIGPGSGSQYIGFDRFDRRGRWGVFVQRVSLDDDAYFPRYGSTVGSYGNNVRLTLGGSLLRFVRGFALGASLSVTREFNRHWVVEYDVTNVQAGLVANWQSPR